MHTDISQHAAIFNNDGKVLLLRRSKTDKKRPGQWDLPGGLMDKGETIEEGLKREIAEEAGLKVNNSKLVFTTTKVRKWLDNSDEKVCNVVYLFYTAKTSAPVVQLSHEHDSFQWIDINKAESELEYDVLIDFFRHLSVNDLTSS